MGRGPADRQWPSRGHGLRRTAKERIQFNDDTSGSAAARLHPRRRRRDLPEIRRLLFEGKQREAEKLAMEHFMSVPSGRSPTSPSATFHGVPRSRQVDRLSPPAGPRLRRRHDRYRDDGVTFTREVFASSPTRRSSCASPPTRPGPINFTATLRASHSAASTKAAGETAHAGRRPDRGEFRGDDVTDIESAIRFEAQLQVPAEGGKVHDRGGIEVAGADAARCSWRRQRAT